jgi:hypothetical protein
LLPSSGPLALLFATVRRLAALVLIAVVAVQLILVLEFLVASLALVLVHDWASFMKL